MHVLWFMFHVVLLIEDLVLQWLPALQRCQPKPSAKAMPDPPVGHMLEKLVIKGRVRPMKTNKQPQADDLEAIQQMHRDLERAEQEATLEAMDLDMPQEAPAAPEGGDAREGAGGWEVGINPPPPPAAVTPGDWQVMKQPKKWHQKKADVKHPWQDPTPWSWHMSSSSSSWDGWQWHRQDHHMQLGKIQRHADMSPFMVTQCIPVRSFPCPC